jgi:flavin-dependent dehydrogenase
MKTIIGGIAGLTASVAYGEAGGDVVLHEAHHTLGRPLSTGTSSTREPKSTYLKEDASWSPAAPEP